MIDNNIAIFQEIQQNLYIVTADSLNVRSGAGINCPIVGGLYKDTLVDVVSIDNGWALLRNGTYVCADYITKYTDDIEWKVTTTARLNLRNKPTTRKSYVITKIPKGTTLDVIKESGGWLKVKYKKYTGWVSGIYLK